MKRQPAPSVAWNDDSDEALRLRLASVSIRPDEQDAEGGRSMRGATPYDVVAQRSASSIRGSNESTNLTTAFEALKPKKKRGRRHESVDPCPPAEERQGGDVLRGAASGGAASASAAAGVFASHSSSSVGGSTSSSASFGGPHAQDFCSRDADEVNFGGMLDGPELLARARCLDYGAPVISVTGFVVATDPATGKRFTVFEIRIETIGMTWTVVRRYTDFIELGTALGDRCPSGLPSKTPFGGNFAEDFLVKRGFQLEAWLLKVLTDSEALRILAIRDFLTIPKHQPAVGAFPPPRALSPRTSAGSAASSASPRDLALPSTTSASSSATREGSPNSRGGPSQAYTAVQPVQFSMLDEDVLMSDDMSRERLQQRPPPLGRPPQTRLDSDEQEDDDRLLGFDECPTPKKGAVPAFTPPRAVPMATQPMRSISTSPRLSGLSKTTLTDFEMLKVLGKGSFGKVVLARKLTGRDTGAMYAIKILHKENLVKKKQVEHTLTERSVLGKMKHPFIVRLHYAFQTEDKLHFVLDFVSGGELFFHLGRAGVFSEKLGRFYAAEIALALGHLHANGVVYRDLKPENVLIQANGHLKLADFGLSKEGIRSVSQGSHSFCGTPEYLAPEVLDRAGHGTAVDWWSLGALLYEMFAGLPPWYSQDQKKMFAGIRTAPLKFTDDMSPLARSVLSDFLQRVPSERLGARGVNQVKAHPFFAEIDWVALYELRVEPPFIPPVFSATDTNNFESDFTRLPVNSAEDVPLELRPSEPMPVTAINKPVTTPTSPLFGGFTYQQDHSGILGKTPNLSMTPSALLLTPPTTIFKRYAGPAGSPPAFNGGGDLSPTPFRQD